MTASTGEYRLLNMAAGAYTLKVERSGFATRALQRVELLVGQNATIPFIMTVAATSSTVDVTTEAPLVDVSSSQVAGNVDRRQMEELPLAGRNWMELAIMIKGITSNNVDQRPGIERDDQFQLNLDGQQITEKIGTSATYGQPKFSREAIAEFQIVTNLFDVTQGRSMGAQVQAISRSGTNDTHGTFYGYFRDDKFQARDRIANAVLPYQNQQTGGSIGGPIRKNKLLYFVSFEHEREPQTQLSQVAVLPSVSWSYKNTISQNSVLARADYKVSAKDNLSVRGTFWNLESPFDLVSTLHPSAASARKRAAGNYLASWTRVLDANHVQDVQVGYARYHGQTLLAFPQLLTTPLCAFPGIQYGGSPSLPGNIHQNVFTARYDLT